MSRHDEEPPDAVVVGAGLAGLTCALELQRAGRRVRLLEAADEVGGRVATDEVGGFLLDRGFQVLLPSYPEAQRQLDLAALELGSFAPGAVVRTGGRFVKLADPRRAFGAALSGAFGGVGTLGDKLKTLGFERRLRRALDEGYSGSALDALNRAGFSPRFRDAFLRPFLGGIFLDRDLGADAGFLGFCWSMFQRGLASLPKRGMGEIPAQLARRLFDGVLTTGARVASVDEAGVALADGSRVDAPNVVLATDGTAAAALAGDATWAPEWNAVTTLSFSAARAPYEGPWLLLNGEEGLVNDVVVYTEVQPSYAPAGLALVSVSVLGDPEDADEALTERVRGELEAWFGGDVARWELLRVLRIPHALPRALREPRAPHRTASGARVAGDHAEAPSIHHAMLSGRRVAEEIVATKT